MELMELMERGGTVPAVPHGGTQGLYRGPVPSSSADTGNHSTTGRSIKSRSIKTSRKATKPPADKRLSFQKHRPTRTAKPPEPWPPPAYALPSTDAAIEAGRQQQAELFPEPADDSRQGRLRRLIGDTSNQEGVSPYICRRKARRTVA